MSTKASCPWITFDLIENLIQRSKADDELKLKSFIVQSGIGKAENFCSNIFRVSATFSYGTQTEQTQSFIVKSSLNVDEFDTINDEVAYFPREIRIYNEILPKVEELLSRIDNVRIAPRYFRMTSHVCLYFNEMKLIYFSVFFVWTTDAMQLERKWIIWYLKIWFIKISIRSIRESDWITIIWRWLYPHWPNGMRQQRIYT